MHRMCRYLSALLLILGLPMAAVAESFISLGTAARPLVDMRGSDANATRSASLFSGGGGLFAPVIRSEPAAAPRQVARARVTVPQGGQWQAARIFDVIARAEAGRDGYDAVQHGARIRPGRPPTQMTLREIYRWIDRTPGQPHAIGRYQFIPPTLRSLVSRLDLPLDTRFSPEVQDSLAYLLLQEAGFEKMQDGGIQRRVFMRNLARIWAGLPLPSGLSYYQGYAGNKATMSWDSFYGEIRQIFPG